MKYIIFTFFPEFIANLKKIVTEYFNNFFENARKFRNVKAVELLLYSSYESALLLYVWSSAIFITQILIFLVASKDRNSCLYIQKLCTVHHIKQITFGFLVFTSV